ncbi:hypothetical protein [Ruminococcus sp.]|uniref:hypothetical protein n=1 Tax=Ruminococcus sp. TaxID=41978 RepID=UPI002E79357E|nr:hypothetical protein [Ruminococcus sp.]MEE0502708.1 hypothetical protein [Ruminococcus sp.]
MPPLYRLVEVGIYSLLNFLPLMVLALYPFRHRLRFSKTATVGLVVALSLVQIFLGWQAAFFSTNAGLLSAVSTLLYAAFYFFAVKVKVGKTGFTLLLLSNNAALSSLHQSVWRAFCSRHLPMNHTAGRFPFVCL